MRHSRFVYETVAISTEQAQKIKDSEIACCRARVLEAEEELLHARSAPLRLTRERQIEVLPGDPRYEDAPFALDCAKDQGTMEWKKIDSRAIKS